MHSEEVGGPESKTKIYMGDFPEERESDSRAARAAGFGPGARAAGQGKTTRPDSLACSDPPNYFPSPFQPLASVS